MSRTSTSALLSLLLLPLATQADDWRIDYGGHTKVGLTAQGYPDDSLFRDVFGASSLDTQGSLRLNLEARRRGWSFDLNYELAVLSGDSLDARGTALPEAAVFLSRLPDDDRRLFRLTDTIDDSGRTAILHRLDRLWVGYATEKAVVRFGRQALSWGNGLFYAPMDLVNPFDPSTIDTEYKSGDDMLYAQYLRDSGADIQGAWVIRRNAISGDVDADEATLAVKYHGFAASGEFDVLAARHFGDSVIGIGVSRGVGGAQVSADAVVTRTDIDTYVELVANLNYSWTAFGKNMSGAFEYYFNGLGQRAGRYGSTSLEGNPDLLLRIVRGQGFTLGRHYLAAAVQIEVTPLWSVSPTLLTNLADPSALLQLITTYSLSDNIVLLGSVNLPLGASGTEFGGTDTGLADKYLSTGAGVFAQFAWYF